MVRSEREFETVIFYKAFSGLGFVLGFMTYDLKVKLSDYGLFAVRRNVVNNEKLEVLLTDDVEKICEVYGISFEKYQKGFETRMDLF